MLFGQYFCANATSHVRKLFGDAVQIATRVYLNRDSDALRAVPIEKQLICDQNQTLRPIDALSRNSAKPGTVKIFVAVVGSFSKEPSFKRRIAARFVCRFIVSFVVSFVVFTGVVAAVVISGVVVGVVVVVVYWCRASPIRTLLHCFFAISRCVVKVGTAAADASFRPILGRRRCIAFRRYARRVWCRVDVQRIVCAFFAIVFLMQSRSRSSTQRRQK